MYALINTMNAHASLFTKGKLFSSQTTKQMGFTWIYLFSLIGRLLETWMACFCMHGLAFLSMHNSTKAGGGERLGWGRGEEAELWTNKSNWIEMSVLTPVYKIEVKIQVWLGLDVVCYCRYAVSFRLSSYLKCQHKTCWHSRALKPLFKHRGGFAPDTTGAYQEQSDSHCRV